MLRTLLVLCSLMLSATQAAAELQKVVVAGGCFWCVESDFDKVEGVSATVSGYAGGTTDNPTYKDVTGGSSGHYEVVQITYDDAVVSFETLIGLFLRSIDPLDPDGQFCDRGDSYRTAIFTGSPEEAAAARAAVAEAQMILGKTVVTEVLAASPFYPAEDYHQDFYQKNPLRYGAYRRGCGRDKRVQEVWGDQAIGGHS